MNVHLAGRTLGKKNVVLAFLDLFVTQKDGP